jgi:[acyl-carrier-protein] S-malonyltransferase
MIGILCSGQGDQHADMFASLRHDPVAASLLNRAIAERWLEDDVAAWLTSPSKDEATLHVDRFAQPLLCLYQQAAWAAISARIGRVGLFAGLSLGELSATACAGAIDAPTVVRLAAHRAKLMDAAAPPGTLVAVLGLDREEVGDLCRETGAAVAIQTAPTHWTLGCLAADRDTLVKSALAKGATTVAPLGVTIASHTPWMKSAVAPFRAELEAVRLARPRSPIVAGVTAQRIWSPNQLVDGLCNQLYTTIRWDLCIETALSSGLRVFLEIGPGSTLSHGLLHRDPTVSARSINEFSSLTESAVWATKLAAINP